jgi:hypothetical protein
MKRRNFISNAGIISAAILLPFQKLFAKTFFLNTDLKIWTELIDYARWCPSPHNVQPWKIKIISGTEAHLYYDPERLPIVVDGTSSFTTAGLGMFIECLNIAAHPLGYKITFELEQEKQLDASAKELKFFARLFLIETKEGKFYDRELIKQRKTSRLHYDGRIIEPKIIFALTNIAHQHGYNFIFSSNKELIDFSIALNSESVLIRSDEEEACKEMQKWIRTTDKEAAEKKDGWWYRCTGTSAKMLYNFFYHHEKFTSKWKRKKSKQILNKTMKGTANLAWITGPFENRNDWVKAGIMLQRLWLEMTKYNVYMHPFGPVITTLESKEKFRQKINYDEIRGELWFLVRMGYSNEPPRSFRLDTKDILII